jgi:hypothetical protein
MRCRTEAALAAKERESEERSTALGAAATELSERASALRALQRETEMMSRERDVVRAGPCCSAVPFSLTNGSVSGSTEMDSVRQDRAQDEAQLRREIQAARDDLAQTRSDLADAKHAFTIERQQAAVSHQRARTLEQLGFTADERMSDMRQQTQRHQMEVDAVAAQLADERAARTRAECTSAAATQRATVLSETLVQREADLRDYAARMQAVQDECMGKIQECTRSCDRSGLWLRVYASRID